MSKHYKIHPGIGVARVGQSQDGYFLGPETMDGRAFELSPAGEVGLRGYKDSSFLIRRQGVRFRVFEYERDDATGALAFVGEVTSDKAAIRWSLALGNRKAAGPLMVSSTGPQEERIIVPRPPASGVISRRNNGVADRTRLETSTSLSGLEGANRPLQALQGRIMDKDVLLGEAGTDHLGRLVVLGGTGQAASWETPMAALPDFLNNNGWFDDIADGPIDAELVFPDGRIERVHDGAWVIVAPPDFAPEVRPFVSLYDLMFDALVQAGRLPHPSRVSFQHDIRPILERAASLRWVNRKSLWNELAVTIEDLAALADASEGARPNREDAHQILLQCEDELDGFRLTRTQKELLDNWVEGRFESDLSAPDSHLNAAEELDRAVLTRCIGSGLFPGIEMGFLATNPTLYAELGRFTRGSFDDFNGVNTLEAGSVTQRMAVPWHADFMECAVEWWPVQRPDTALFRQDGTPTSPGFRWDRGLVVPQPDDFDSPESHLNMVLHFAKLGVVDRITVGGEEVLAETGRSPELGS